MEKSTAAKTRELVYLINTNIHEFKNHANMMAIRGITDEEQKGLLICLNLTIDKLKLVKEIIENYEINDND